MTRKILRTADKAGLIAGTALLAALTGCATDGSNQRSAYLERPAVYRQSTVVIHDDYDYFPGYEVYYSRNRREYVYRDGSTWVRQPAPRGVTVAVLSASPSVRMEFQDPPEQHHSTVVRSYPKNWAPPGKRHGDKDERKEEKKKDKKSDDRRD